MACRSSWIGLLLLASVAADCRGARATQLSDLSIEELLELEVRSVSRRSEKWTESAAAVFVITGEEIRRSGALTLPEALRLVPGLHAAQINASQWAISARGFNGQFANKTLVLIDGRSLYSHLTGGVVWEFQDLPLENIERIEVMRGPGATLWGAGAVNGVINIITRKAADTQGGLLSIGGGDPVDSAFLLRWGDRRKDTAYRFWVKHLDHGEGQTPEGGPAFDDWRADRGGLRLDHELGIGSLSFDLALAEGHTDGRVDEFGPDPPYLFRRDRRLLFRQRSGSVRFHREKGSSALQVQVHAEHLHQRSGLFEEVRLNTELDLQHQWTRGRHELIWGFDYRRSSDDFTNTFDTRFPTKTEPFRLWSAFLQDQIVLSPRLRLIGGFKLEQRGSASAEGQPSLRLAWSPNSEQTFWLAASKAARFPTRSELNIRRVAGLILLPNEVPLFSVVEGSSNLGTEEMTAYEAGFRRQLGPQLFLDLALFDFHYEHLLVLRQQELQVDASFGTWIVPLTIQNGARGRSRGIEGNLIWQPTDSWRFDLGFSTLDMKVELDHSTDIRTESPGTNPELQAFGRFRFSQPKWQAGLDLRWIDELPDFAIPAGFTADLNLTIDLPRQMRLQLTGRNLPDRTHREYRGNAAVITQQNAVSRSLLVQLEWRF